MLKNTPPPPPPPLVCVKAELNQELLQEVDFSSNVFRALTGHSGASHTDPRDDTGSDLGGQNPAFQWAQNPRAWISMAGAVSPSHFDSSPSMLVQVNLGMQLTDLFTLPSLWLRWKWMSVSCVVYSCSSCFCGSSRYFFLLNQHHRILIISIAV